MSLTTLSIGWGTLVRESVRKLFDSQVCMYADEETLTSLLINVVYTFGFQINDGAIDTAL